MIRIAAAVQFGLLLCAPAAIADGMPTTILSSQELSAAVTGNFVSLRVQAITQGNRNAGIDLSGNRTRNFSGIQSISIEDGIGSVSQAATSLSIRAGLSLRAEPRWP